MISVSDLVFMEIWFRLGRCAFPWFVHDQRTLELCEYHGLPYINIGSGNVSFGDILELTDKCNYTRFFSKYEENRWRLKYYLNQSGINDALGTF